jgi:hypothetical protein
MASSTPWARKPFLDEKHSFTQIAVPTPGTAVAQFTASSFLKPKQKPGKEGQLNDAHAVCAVPGLNREDSESTLDKSLSSGSSQNSGHISRNIQGQSIKGKRVNRPSRRKSQDLEGMQAENEAAVRLFVYNQAQKAKELESVSNARELLYGPTVKQVCLSPNSESDACTASPPSVTMYPNGTSTSSSISITSTPAPAQLSSQADMSPATSARGQGSHVPSHVSAHASMFDQSSAASPRSGSTTSKTDLDSKKKAIQSALQLDYGGRRSNKADSASHHSRLSMQQSLKAFSLSPQIAHAPSSSGSISNPVLLAQLDRKFSSQGMAADNQEWYSNSSNSRIDMTRSASAFSAFDINVTNLNGIAVEDQDSVNYLRTRQAGAAAPNVDGEPDRNDNSIPGRFDALWDSLTTNRTTNIETGCLGVNYFALPERIFGFFGMNDRKA